MDFLTDRSGRHLVRLETVMTVPDFVKNATVDAESVAGLGDHIFADPVRREFPLDNAGHTFLSYAYCKSASVSNTLLLDRIKKAAQRHGITSELQSIDAAFDGLQKQAATSIAFAVQIDFGAGDPNSDHPHIKSGGVKGFYPINSTEEIENSSRQIANDRSRIPLPVFVEGCQAIVKAASEFHMSDHQLPKVVLQYGLERMPNHEYVEHEAELRRKLTGDDIYGEIAKSAAENAENRPMSDYVALWAEADNQHGLDYTRSVVDPWFIFNSGPVKSTYDTQINQWLLIQNVAVPRAALARLPEEEVRKRFNKEASEKVLAAVKSASGSDDDPIKHLDGLTIDQRKLLLRTMATS